MIFCNNCGNPLDARGVCPTCEIQPLPGGRGTPPPTERLPSSAAAARAAAPTAPYQQANAGNAQAGSPTSPYQQPNFGSAPPPYGYPPATTTGGADYVQRPQPAVKPSPVPIVLIVVVGLVLIVGVAVLTYFVASSQTHTGPTSVASNPPTSSGAPTGPTTPINTGLSADQLAVSLNSAIDSGRLVNLSGDDAYSSFTQLRAIDPKHPALSNAKSRVLQKLRDQGEEIISRKVNHSGEVSLQDWQISVRRYEWAHALEPGDQALEARQRYFQGKLAEALDRRPDAWQHFIAAAKLDSSWAVPQNDLGFWITQSPGAGDQRWSNAIPYYERAINLQPDWEIPYNNLGTAYFYLKNYDEAESRYRQAIQRNTNWARPHKWLGDVYNAKSNFSAAIQEYQSALNLYNPKTDSLDTAGIQRKIAELRAKGY